MDLDQAEQYWTQISSNIYIYIYYIYCVVNFRRLKYFSTKSKWLIYHVYLMLIEPFKNSRYFWMTLYIFLSIWTSAALLLYSISFLYIKYGIFLWSIIVKHYRLDKKFERVKNTWCNSVVASCWQDWLASLYQNSKAASVR